MTAPVWYHPSFYGDIRLEAMATSGKQKMCRLVAEKLSETEKLALRQLDQMARKKGWLTYQATLINSTATVIEAPIEKVAKALASFMKPGRKTVSAVKFTDGKMEEVVEADLPAEPAMKQVPGNPYRAGPVTALAVRHEEEAVPATIVPTPVAAVTVAAPVLGCPAPDFRSAELKARAVLSVFLTDEQREDFGRHNRFITTGSTTGHRYVITSRHARDELSKYQRTLFDLDDRLPYCVHDWSVPAAEEMLALHVLLQLPGYEGYLRYLED
jgi:hypothetical protein